MKIRNKKKFIENKKQMGKKKFTGKSFTLFMAIVLTVTLCGSGLAFAANENSVRSDLNDVNQQQKNVGAQMAQVEKDVKELQAKVDSLNYQINKATSDISATENKIKAKEDEMQQRENNLNARLKVMYKNGSLGFIDVLLGSGSISEFVSNLEIIQRIYKNDVNVLETLEKEHKELKQIKVDLKKKKESLAAQQQELASEKVQLDEKRSALKKEEDALKAEADRLSAELRKMINTNSTYVGGTFTWPCPASNYITSSFGNRLHPILKSWIYHTGVDIGCSSGKDILAAADGKVLIAQWYGGYGKCVMIDHGGGIVTLYGHSSELCVSQGQSVKRGQVIAKVGSTGRSTGPHLHFEVRKNGDYVNPMSYFK